MASLGQYEYSAPGRLRTSLAQAAGSAQGLMAELSNRATAIQAAEAAYSDTNMGGLLQRVLKKTSEKDADVLSVVERIQALPEDSPEWFMLASVFQSNDPWEIATKIVETRIDKARSEALLDAYYPSGRAEDAAHRLIAGSSDRAIARTRISREAGAVAFTVV